MVILLQGRDAGSDIYHDARPFMPQDRRKNAFWIGTRQRVIVGVTNTGRLDFDQHFAGSGTGKIHFFHGQRCAGLPCDSGFGFHESSVPE